MERPAGVALHDLYERQYAIQASRLKAEFAGSIFGAYSQQKTARPVLFELTEPTRETPTACRRLRLNPAAYGTTAFAGRRSLSSTSALVTCVPVLLLGHTKLESTVRYLGIEVEDANEFMMRRAATQRRRMNNPPQLRNGR
jgi:hypothetical protein